MPLQSQAQRGAMYAAAEGKSTLGIPASVGAKFVAHDQGGKLPARKKAGPKMKKAFSEGRISGRVMERHGYEAE